MPRVSSHKRFRPDGTFFYYYYKKKQGRHKKPGRKKKKVYKKPYSPPAIQYKIIRFEFNRQVEYIGCFATLEQVNYAVELLKKKNESVIFPRRFYNNGRINNKIGEYKNEYVILKKKTEEDGDGITKLRDEYGKFVEHKTTSDRWVVYDKFNAESEETFWVYPYSPQQRKTFSWILEELINKKLETDFDLVNIFLINNKVVFRYGVDSYMLVICKNTSDAIRMYNLIEEYTKKNKRVILTGSVRARDDRGKEVIDYYEKHGFEKKKFLRYSTRH